MLIENALSDAVRFLHMNALSSAVGLKVDFDMALLGRRQRPISHPCTRMRGYADAQARQIFRDLIQHASHRRDRRLGVAVQFHRRAQLPIPVASGSLNDAVSVSWWHGLAGPAVHPDPPDPGVGEPGGPNS